MTSFAIPQEALGFWLERLIHHGVRYEGPRQREAPGGLAEPVVAFRDPDGLMLELVAAPGVENRPGWEGAPGVPAEHTLRGFHSVTLWEKVGDDTERILVDILGFRPMGAIDGTHRFAAGDGGPGNLVEVRRVGGFPDGFDGVGGIHHVAFRVADDLAQLDVRRRVIEAELRPTPVIDRQYFHSVYFREPGGVLFELATDRPGFLIDESKEHLGEGLKLPPQFESRREHLAQVLPPIHLPGSASDHEAFTTLPDPAVDATRLFIHRYLPPEAGAEPAGLTLLLLHGTGADENDLVPLGRALLPGAGLLSPRGKVLEHGMSRFFRRRAEGVFDLDDLGAQTDELARFVAAAPAAYHATAPVVAVGFSNGANIAVSLLLRHSGLLKGAVLLSPMLPYEPDQVGDLTGTEIFIGAGQQDPTAPAEQVERLARVLQAAGAMVTIEWYQGGHGITESEVAAARDWLRGVARRLG